MSALRILQPTSLDVKKSDIKLELTRDSLRFFFRSFVRSFVRSLIHSFVRSFGRPFDLIRSFVS